MPGFDVFRAPPKGAMQVLVLSHFGFCVSKIGSMLQRANTVFGDYRAGSKGAVVSPLPDLHLVWFDGWVEGLGIGILRLGFGVWG